MTLEELAAHCQAGDCLIALYGQVIDVSQFLSRHPGGEKILLAQAGKDATEKFESIHASSGGFELVSKWCPDSVVASLSDWKGPAPPMSSTKKYPGAVILWPLVLLIAVVACHSNSAMA